MRILVVGAGSLGGYIGGRLAQAGRDVTFLVRPGRAERLRSHGLLIVSPRGDLTLDPQLVTAATLTTPYDVVLLAVKGFSLDAAIADLAPAVGAETMILPVLNGMRHMDALADRFGAARVLGCACKIATSLDTDGRIVQLAPAQDLAYGELDGQRSERIERLDALMQGAGLDARLSPAIESEMWEKWVMLATIGGINCLMRGNIGQVASATGGTEFALAFLAECVAIVSAAGHAPRATFLAEMRETLSDKGSQQTTSTYRDLLAGLPVEADQIIGDLLSRGRALGVAAPFLAAAAANLSVYQSSLEASA